MIIDRVKLAGPRLYLLDAAGNPNLAPPAGGAATTRRLERGAYWELSSITFVIEGPDLGPLMRRTATPMVSISLQKELFPRLFADPYRHRVYTIGGLVDFREGTADNCRAMEVGGTPTLVSMEPGTCKWVSRRFELPDDASFVSAGWSLAPSTRTEAGAFVYGLALRAWDSAGTQLVVPAVVGNADPSAPRVAACAVAGVRSFEIEFSADVATDGYFHERHVGMPAKPTGRALLQAVALLEPIPSRLAFYSLQELLNASSRYEMLPTATAPITRLVATISLPVTLVGGPVLPGTPATDFEFIRVQIDPGGALAGGALTLVEASLDGFELWRLPAP